jgi:hypothetical protein
MTRHAVLILALRFVAVVLFLAACVRAARDSTMDRRRAKLLARMNQ